MRTEKRERELVEPPGISCILQKAQEWGATIKIMVIGGQAVLGYCGRIRTSKDTDAVSPSADTGLLLRLLSECGFDVERSNFGLRCRRQRNGDWDVIHISLGDIADESRGEGNVLRYPVPASSYAEAVELPLQGLALDKATPPPIAPVLPLEDLIITKILPVGRTTDMEDVVLLLVTAVEQISLDKIVAKIRDLEELKPAILERLEDLAEFILEHQIGTTWLGRPWTPAERTRVLQFIRKLNSQVQ